MQRNCLVMDCLTITQFVCFYLLDKKFTLQLYNEYTTAVINLMRADYASRQSSL